MKNCKNCNKPIKWGKYAQKKEIATGLCVDCLNKPFEITSVCRLDLIEHFTPKQIAKFDDASMERLSRKMADAYCNEGFWTDLEIIGEYILEDK